jgi:hypothetical protein
VLEVCRLGHRPLVVVRGYASVSGIVWRVVVIFGVDWRRDMVAGYFTVEVVGFVDNRRKNWVGVPALGPSFAIRPADPAGDQNPVLLAPRAMLVLMQVQRFRVTEPARLGALSVHDLARDDSVGRLTSSGRLRITFLASKFLSVSLPRLGRGFIASLGRRRALAKVM